MLVNKEGSTDFPAYLGRAIKAAGFDRPTFFARKAGIDPSVVFRWLSGEQRPSVASLERVAPILGVPVPELVAVAYPSAGDAAAKPTDPDQFVDPQTGERYDDEDERMLWSLRPLPEDTRRYLIYALRAREAAARPSRRGVA